MWWIIFIILIALLNLFYVIGVFVFDEDAIELLPWDLHKNTNMNWLGSIVTSLLLLAILPLAWLVKFIYWLFHVGRE